MRGISTLQVSVFLSLCLSASLSLCFFVCSCSVAGLREKKKKRRRNEWKSSHLPESCRSWACRCRPPHRQLQTLMMLGCHPFLVAAAAAAAAVEASLLVWRTKAQQVGTASTASNVDAPTSSWQVWSCPIWEFPAKGNCLQLGQSPESTKANNKQQ